MRDQWMRKFKQAQQQQHHAKVFALLQKAPVDDVLAKEALGNIGRIPLSWNSEQMISWMLSYLTKWVQAPKPQAPLSFSPTHVDPWLRVGFGMVMHVGLYGHPGTALNKVSTKLPPPHDAGLLQWTQDKITDQLVQWGKCRDAKSILPLLHDVDEEACTIAGNLFPSSTLAGKFLREYVTYHLRGYYLSAHLLERLEEDMKQDPRTTKVLFHLLEQEWGKMLQEVKNFYPTDTAKRQWEKMWEEKDSPHRWATLGSPTLQSYLDQSLIKEAIGETGHERTSRAMRRM